MNLKRKQRAITLITALIMLVVLTLLVLSALNSSTTNLRVAGNMQVQQEAVAAGQQAIETVISNNFALAPAASTVMVPMGGATYAATVPVPVCTCSKPLLNSDPNLPVDCLSGGKNTSTGIVFSSGPVSTGTSWCYAQQWEVRASVQDANTGTSTTLHQGIYLDVPAGTMCPGGSAC